MPSVAAGQGEASPRPLVGRRSEQDSLAALLDGIGTGRGVAALVGEAGIGKTRLAHWASERAVRDGLDVAWAQATPNDAGIPLGLFQDLLRRDGRSAAFVPADPLAAGFPQRILPELGGEPPGQASGRSVLFEAATRWFRERCRPGGLLVVLEDLHWADETSLALATHLVRVALDAPIAVLATLRPTAGEPGPASDALRELRRTLARVASGSELELAPLDAGAIGELVGAVTGGTTDEQLAREVARLSGGNPFIALELALSGAARPGTGGVAPGGRLAWSLRDLVEHRLAPLSASAQEVARWAAVLGEPFDVALLAGASSLERDVLAGVLEELIRAGVVRESDSPLEHGARMQFCHALTQVAILDRMLEADRATRHLAILRVADAGTGSLTPEEALAHARGAHDRPRIVQLSLEAARRAAAQGALADAEAHYRRGRELWREPDGARLRADIAQGLGALAGVLQPRLEAVELLLEARLLYEQLGDQVAAVNAQVDACHVRWKAGDPAGARDVVALVDELAAAPPAALVRALSGASSLTTLTGGDPELALALARRGLELAPELPASAAALERVRLLNVIGMCALQRGDYSYGRETLHECARLALEVGHPAGDVVALGNLAVIGQWDAAPSLGDVAAIADRALASARYRGMRGHEAWLAAARAAIHLRAGEPEAADEAIELARAALAEAPEQAYERQLTIVVAQAALQRGELEVARDGFQAALAETHEKLDEAERHARLGLAEALLALGDDRGALAAVAPWSLAAREHPGQLRTYGSLLAVGVEAAAGCGDPVAGSWASLLTEHAPGPRAVLATALVELGRDGSADLVSVGTAIDELAASGRVWEAARLRQVVAERAGDATRHAVVLAAQARADFVAMPADPWARRAERFLRLAGEHVVSRRTASNAAGLTGRELEVLGLLADGLSNSELAARLHVSLPTVETHLRNVYRKLGVRRRTEALRAARELGLLPERARA